jgi:hypothetical protein
MATTDLECQFCNTILEVDNDLIGQKIECPSCSKIITVTEPKIAGETSKKTFKINHRVNAFNAPPSPSAPQQYQQSTGGGLKFPVVIILVLLLIGVILASLSFVQSRTRFEYTQNITQLQLECTKSINQSIARLQLEYTQSLTRPYFYEYTHINFLAGSNQRTGYSALKYASINFDKSILNKMGSEGWEMVGCYLEMETAFPNLGTGDYVTGLQPNIRPQCLVVIFKRRMLGAR